MSATKDFDNQRARFLRHFEHFGSDLRFPIPYGQFSGKANSRHAHFCFDARGFRNLTKDTYFPNGAWPRVFVLGGSTMVEGVTEEDTVPGRIQAALRSSGYSEAEVFNFGVVSTCFKQMSALAWSHLVDLRPDTVVVVGGGTDLTNPWTFDPRPGYPHNAFVTEQVYDFLFNTNRIAEREIGLGYEELMDLIYARLQQLRLEYGWRTPDWEIAIADGTRDAVRSFAALASALRVPVICVLQPTIVRSKNQLSAETSAGSDEFLSYLDRQYQRLVCHFQTLGRISKSNAYYSVHDLSDKFSDELEKLFYDAAHYNERGRQIMADDLSIKIRKKIDNWRWGAARWMAPIRYIRSVVQLG